MKEEIHFTSEGYFPNRDAECGIASLANLIYFQYGDLNTAKKIYFNARKHPLVGEDGTTNIIFFPELLKELSSEKYSGVSQLPKSSKDFDFLENLKGRDDKLLEKYHKKSLDLGLLSFSDKLELNAPYILFLAKSQYEGHAVVNTGNFFIDNGQVSYQLPQGFKISGAFKAHNHIF